MADAKIEVEMPTHTIHAHECIYCRQHWSACAANPVCHPMPVVSAEVAEANNWQYLDDQRGWVDCTWNERIGAMMAGVQVRHISWSHPEAAASARMPAPYQPTPCNYYRHAEEGSTQEGCSACHRRNQDGTEQELPPRPKPTIDYSTLLEDESEPRPYVCMDSVNAYADEVERQLRAALSANAQLGQKMAATEKERDEWKDRLSERSDSYGVRLRWFDSLRRTAEAEVARLKLAESLMEAQASALREDRDRWCDKYQAAVVQVKGIVK